MAGEECTEAAKACTIRISAPAEGIADPETPAAFLGASADGRLVYFLDKGRLTADSTAGAGYDLYRYDLASGGLTDLTPDTADRNGARGRRDARDGGIGPRRLLRRRRRPRRRREPGAGRRDQPLRPARHGRSRSWRGWGPKAANRRTGARIPSKSRTVHRSRVTPDGQALLFTSARRLTSYDSHGKEELYLHRAGGGISCLSCNPSGEAPAGPAGVQRIPATSVTKPPPGYFMTRNLSPDGRRVFFDSGDRLVSGDRNSVNDVYEWEAPDPSEPADTCTTASSAYVPSSGGCLYLISSGAPGAGPSWFGDADEKGKNVFLFTDRQLVAQDRDQLVDVYDARVGGGIAAQQQAAASEPCESAESCHGSAAPTSPPQSPATSTFAGAGNVKPAPRCAKGKVRRNGRCVRRHPGGTASGRSRHHRSTGNDGKARSKGAAPEARQQEREGRPAMRRTVGSSDDGFPAGARGRPRPVPGGRPRARLGDRSRPRPERIRIRQPPTTPRSRARLPGPGLQRRRRAHRRRVHDHRHPAQRAPARLRFPPHR